MAEKQHFEFHGVNAGVNIQHVASFWNPVKWPQPLPCLTAAAFIWFTVQRQFFCSCQQNNCTKVTRSFRFAFVCRQSPHIVIFSMDKALDCYFSMVCTWPILYSGAAELRAVTTSSANSHEHTCIKIFHLSVTLSYTQQMAVKGQNIHMLISLASGNHWRHRMFNNSAHIDPYLSAAQCALELHNFLMNTFFISSQTV